MSIGSVMQQQMTEEKRMEQYAQERKTLHEREMANMDKEFVQEAEKLQTFYKEQKKALEKDFSVSLSEQAKAQATKLATVRKSNAEEIEREKADHEATLRLVEERAEKQIQNVRKKNEENVAKIHAGYQKAQEELRKSNGD